MEETLRHPKVRPVLQTLLKQAASYLDAPSVERLKQAAEVAAHAHRAQKRKSGEPYIAHPLAVAGILADMYLDPETLLAAVLHDTIEDTELTAEDLRSAFGDAVCKLVEGVTKLDHMQFNSRSEATAETFRKMVLAMAQDPRVIMVKLADRVHNMRTIAAMSPASRRRISRETLEIYAPIADKLGMHELKMELEDLGFSGLYPLRHKVLSKRLSQNRKRHERLMSEVQAQFCRRLESLGLSREVSWRAKTPYSVYLKIRDRGYRFSTIMDFYGFRILVDTEDECYRTLGVVHALYPPMNELFKDYIALPKPNGYQSLHTVLTGPQHTRMEVQIRTHDMHEVAERGIAAHYAYKHGEGYHNGGVQIGEWLQSIMEIQGQTEDSEEFLDSLKTQLQPDEVYVRTPKDKIISLPLHATALDFAYAVHTDVGNHAVGAWIDDVHQPLSTELQNGQVVRIITAESATPKPHWLEFIVTAKARAAIRQYLKQLEHEDAVVLGHRMLDRAFNQLGHALEQVDAERMQAYLEESGFQRLEELLRDIAMGNRLPRSVARQLLALEQEPEALSREALVISGEEGQLVNFAQCCYPIPGDAIMGHITSGKGMVIHRINCPNMREIRKASDRWIACRWDDRVKGEYIAALRVETLNERGVLAAVSANISRRGMNIDRVDYPERDEERAVLLIHVFTADRVQLAGLIRSLRRMRVVLKVHRI